MKRVVMILLVVGCLIGIGSLHANKASDGDGLVVTLSPKVLMLDSQVDTLTLHSNIPLGTVVCSSLALDGVAPYLVKADSLGCLVAKFWVEDFQDLQAGPVTLTLTGWLVDIDGIEVPFAVSDTILVK